jgi:hypothetical protein
MTRRFATRGVLAAALLALAVRPSRPAAQVYLGEVPEYQLSGNLLVSYAGSWQRVGDQLVETHQLSEGLSLTLSGWIFDSRYVKFRTYVLALRLDTFSAARSKGYSLGYGGSLSFFSRSILPLTFAYGQGLAVTGSTVLAAGVTSTTMFQAIAQVVSPALPRAEVRAQRLILDDAAGGRTTSDNVAGSVYGASSLHRYAAVASWEADQYGLQNRTTRTLASISDDVYASQDTRASFSASLSQSAGLGGTDDTFTSYQASGAMLSRLSSRTLLRAQYGFSTLSGPDREETANQVSAGSTINLRPLPILLGEGLAATTTRFDAPGLHRLIDAASAYQGVATTGRWRTLTGTLAATGQLGYASVSDGLSGPVYGYGLNAGLQWAVPEAPVRATAYYNDREDHSSAGTSMHSYGALLSSDVSRFRPLMLLPIASFVHVDQTTLLALPVPTDAGSLATATRLNDSNTLSTTLTGTSPLYRTRLSFASGYVDTWSSSLPAHLRQIFGRVADAFRLGRGTFGNLSIDGSHQLGQGSNVSALASLVWSFRESSLSLSYAYALALPQGSSTHTVALLFTRRFETAFLPESP